MEPYYLIRCGFLHFEKWNKEDEPVFTSNEDKAFRSYNKIGAQSLKAAIHAHYATRGQHFTITIETA